MKTPDRRLGGTCFAALSTFFSTFLGSWGLLMLTLGQPVQASETLAYMDNAGYEYGGEAIEFYVPAFEQGPETLRLNRMLEREHRISTRDYVLLAIVVDGAEPGPNGGYARLSIGRKRGPEIDLTAGNTRILAHAEKSTDLRLYLSGGARINGFTAVLAPKAYTRYRGNDYGYYDRDYLYGGLYLGWVWRDRYYRDSHLYHRHNRLRRSLPHLRNRHHNRRLDRRGVPHRPGIGDRPLYDHEYSRRGYRERGGRHGARHRDRHRDRNDDRAQRERRDTSPGSNTEPGNQNDATGDSPQVIARGSNRRGRGNHEYRGQQREMLNESNRRARRDSRTSRAVDAPARSTARQAQIARAQSNQAAAARARAAQARSQQQRATARANRQAQRSATRSAQVQPQRSQQRSARRQQAQTQQRATVRSAPRAQERRYRNPAPAARAERGARRENRGRPNVVR